MRILALLVLVACGSSSKPAPEPPSNTPPPIAAKPADPCPEVIARSRKVIDEIFQTALKRAATEDDYKLMVEGCRDPATKAESQPLVDCVMAAGNDGAIGACWKAAMKAGEGGDTTADARREKKSEAALQLNKLAKNAKTMWATSMEFAKGRAEPLPKGPCGCPKKCAFTNEWVKDPVWIELDFQIDEEALYTYAYESDGKTFRATATGDLDCDGKPAVWVLTGVGTADGATVTLTPPPSGVY